MKFERLGNIVTIAKGKKPVLTDEPSSKSVRFLQIDDLRNDNNIKYTDDKTGTLATAKDILLAWDGANAGTIGFGKAGYVGSTIAVLRQKEPAKYSTIFIGKFLQSQFDHLRRKATGATIPHIDRGSLDELQIPVIDLQDQLLIANILGKAEALISQRKESLRLLDELLKCTFLEMFGDPVNEDRGWVFKPLANSLHIKHGFAFQSRYFSNMGQFVLLTPGNFQEKGGYKDRLEKQKYFTGPIDEKYLLKKDDLLVAMTEQAPGLLGSPIFVPESNRFLHNQRLGLVEYSGRALHRHFLFHLFNSKSIRALIHSKATGTKVRHTSPTKIEEISIYIPPIELQIKFSHLVEKTEALKIHYQTGLHGLENLYGVLSQRAFTGELRAKSEQMMTETAPKEKYVKK